MKVLQMRQALEQLNTMMTEFGAKAAASDLEKLTSFMRCHDDLTVAKFIEKMEKALEGGGASGARKQNAGAKSVDLDTIAHYEDLIKRRQFDPNNIDALVSTIGKDKSVRLVELRELVARVTGIKTGGLPKRRLLEEIKRSLVEGARDRGRLSFLDSLKS